MKGGAAAAGLALFGSARGAQQEPAPPAAAPPPQAPPAEPSPPQARPVEPVALPADVGREVYLSRIESVRAMLREAGIAAIVETPGAGLRYLTGTPLERYERLVCLLLPAEGAPTLICPAMDREIVAAGPGAVEAIRYMAGEDDPLRIIAEILREAGHAEGRVAISGSAIYDEFAFVHAMLPKLNFVTTSALVGSLRERKSPQEVAILKASAAIAQTAIDRSLKEARAGMREFELAAILDAHVRALGARPGGCQVLFGARTAVHRLPTGEAALTPGAVVAITCSPDVHGYRAPIARSAIMGKTTGRMRMIHDALRDAQQAGLERARPGGVRNSVHLVARSAITSRGFPEFPHPLGHGAGLESSEAPHLSLGDYALLVEGSVATLTPSVQTPGEYAIRIGDLMEVTATSGRWLSQPPRQMVEL